MGLTRGSSLLSFLGRSGPLLGAQAVSNASLHELHEHIQELFFIFFFADPKFLVATHCVVHNKPDKFWLAQAQCCHSQACCQVCESLVMVAVGSQDVINALQGCVCYDASDLAVSVAKIASCRLDNVLFQSCRLDTVCNPGNPKYMHAIACFIYLRIILGSTAWCFTRTP